MRRLKPIVAVFAFAALLWGFGAAWIAGALGWNPVVAAVAAVVPVAVFGWLRRGRELIDVAAPSFAVAYAAYVGLAIVRVAQLDGLQPSFRIDLLDHRWPPVLMAGVAFALILTVCIAVPASLMQRHRHVENERNARFLAFIADRGTARVAREEPPR